MTQQPDGTAESDDSVDSALAAAIDYEWAKKAVNVPTESLASTREAAKGWASTITAITSVFTGAAFITLPKDLTKLSDSDQERVWIWIGIALASSAIAIALAGLASQGWQSASWNSGSALEKATKKHLKISFWLLLASRLLIIPAIIGIAASIYLTATRQEQSSTKSVSAIVLSGNELTCITLGPEETQAVATATHAAASMSVVPSCPKVE